MNNVALNKRPMANMLRIKRRSRPFRSSLAPGTVIMTDDGLLGRVRRFIDDSNSSPAQLEVEDLDGGIVHVSPKEIRLVYV